MHLRSILLKGALFGVLLSSPLAAFAAPAVNVTSSGTGTFTVNGTGFDNVGALELTITYNSSLLKAPQVTKGSLISNSLAVINPDVAGTIRIAAITGSSFPSQGNIVSVTFTPTGSSTGDVTVSGSARTSSNAPIPGSLQAAYIAPKEPSPSEGTTIGGGNGGGSGNISNNSRNSGTITTDNGSTYGGGYVPGTITLPTDDVSSAQRSDQRRDAPEQAPPEPSATEPPIVAEEAAPHPAVQAKESGEAPREAKKEERQKAQSVLERFRLYQGERTVQALTALFDKGNSDGFTQEPAVVLSDGVATASVTITGVTGAAAPNFAFQGARHVSMKQVGDGVWQVQAKPNKDAVISSITMLANGEMREYPLTVAPKARVDLIKPGTVTQADFELFLRERGTPDAPKYDLNGDGKRDYQDDYIFAANYLLAKKMQPAEQKIPAVPKKPEPKKALVLKQGD